ncbi:MAG: FAD-dependent oxidoreductase [Phycisphaerae bacterium]|nr:FAD-dependent oxidoreductase [Phycisphaerae bacterium]
MSNPISSPSKILIEPGKQLPIVDGYDVVVVGGGIAGITAAVAAARNGARTLLAEKNYALGGLATLGNVIVYLPLCDGIPSYAALSPFVRAAGGCSQLARNATGLIEREIASWQTVLFAP